MNYAIWLWTEDNDWDALDFFYTREDAEMHLKAYQDLYSGFLVSIFKRDTN